MHFSCSRELLDKHLQHVSRVVAIRQGLPILSNLLLETDKDKLRISGTDLELAVTTYLPAEIQQEGTFTVPAKLFQEFIHQNPDDVVEFTLESHELVCKSKKIKARIPGLDPEEFPTLPHVESSNIQRLPFQEIVNALRQVVVACAHDNARPILTGVLMRFNGSSVTLVATDSFRLSEKNIALSVPVTEQTEIILPSRTVQELIRISTVASDVTEVEVVIDEKQILFRIGTVEMYSRLLIGIFPKYQAIIPKARVATAEVTTLELVQSLRLLNVFSQSGIANVMFEVTAGGELTVSSYGSQRGSTSHTLYAVLESDFKEIKVPFNSKFLLDACSVINSDHLTIGFSGVTTPLVITTDDPTHLQLVMPIRL